MINFKENSKIVYENLKTTLEEINAGTSEFCKAILNTKVRESDENYILTDEESYESNTIRIMDSLCKISSTGDLSHLGLKVDFDIREKLHIFLAIPLSIKDVKTKMKMYHGFFTDCHIVYQEEWPLEVFTNIASKKLGDNLDESLKDVVANSIARMHKIVDNEISRTLKEDKERVVVPIDQRKEVPEIFLNVYNKNKEKYLNSRTILEKALENAKLSEEIERKYHEENIQMREQGDKKKQETDEAYAECEKME